MWFASSLDNLEERRSALNKPYGLILRMRAPGALRQLEAVLPPTIRRTAQGARTTGACRVWGQAA